MNDQSGHGLNRRQLIGAAAGAAFAAGFHSESTAADKKETNVKNGRINQSIVHWCFAKHWTVEQTIPIAKQLGCKSIELIDPKFFPLLKKNGLDCAIASIDMAPDPPFVRGLNNPKHRKQLFKATRDAIDACKAHGFKRVIAFTGMADGLSNEEGADNCVESLKQIVGYAEKNDVTICLEMLNTRDDTHPMKGHPGYQGDDTEYCIDIIKRVGSPHVKLLFDIYHVQIMNGDVIRRIQQHKEYLGHIHTAGNPGRGELDNSQEISYPACMQALLDVGYDGFVGQEFIPTRDPLKGLQQAVTLCDV
ncbi:MAG: TIM barrel protein [Pirellulaceae bacterium]|jgi:hydroxypyruvate isomerase|nr:TIM barrel protein [Pirellulaceae bacterium]MDP7016297.1 TIM barrel protein [Pirellulaceae bacterium]